jgi:hypothetical protein
MSGNAAEFGNQATAWRRESVHDERGQTASPSNWVFAVGLPEWRPSAVALFEANAVPSPLFAWGFDEASPPVNRAWPQRRRALRVPKPRARSTVTVSASSECWTRPASASRRDDTEGPAGKDAELIVAEQAQQIRARHKVAR